MNFPRRTAAFSVVLYGCVFIVICLKVFCNFLFYFLIDSLDFYYLFIFYFILFFVFLQPHLWHMEVPRLGVELELWLLTYATATATPNLSCIFDLHHSSRQHGIFNPLIEGRDRNHILMDTSRVCNSLSHNGNAPNFFFQHNALKDFLGRYLYQYLVHSFYC